MGKFNVDEFKKKYQNSASMPEVRYTLPISKQEVFYKPITTKQQSAMLKAMEAKDVKLIEKVLDNIISVNTVDEIDVMNMTMVDRKSLLINMVTQSIGDKFDLSLECPECGKNQKMKIDLTKIKDPTISDDKLSKEVTINDYVFTLSIPTRKKMQAIEDTFDVDDDEKVSVVDIADDLITVVIKSVKGEGIEDEDISYEDSIELIKTLTPIDLKQIKEYIDGLDLDSTNKTMFKCKDKECNYKQEIQIQITHLFSK